MDHRLLTSQFEGMTLERATLDFRQMMVKRALEDNGDHHQNAAAALGIHRNTLTRIMAEAGMPLHESRGGNTFNRGNAAWQQLGEHRHGI